MCVKIRSGMSKIRSADERKRLELYIFWRIITWAVRTFFFFFLPFSGIGKEKQEQIQITKDNSED